MNTETNIKIEVENNTLHISGRLNTVYNVYFFDGTFHIGDKIEQSGYEYVITKLTEKMVTMEYKTYQQTETKRMRMLTFIHEFVFLCLTKIYHKESNGKFSIYEPDAYQTQYTTKVNQQ